MTDATIYGFLSDYQTRMEQTYRYSKEDMNSRYIELRKLLYDYDLLWNEQIKEYKAFMKK